MKTDKMEVSFLITVQLIQIKTWRLRHDTLPEGLHRVISAGFPFKNVVAKWNFKGNLIDVSFFKLNLQVGKQLLIKQTVETDKVVIQSSKVTLNPKDSRYYFSTIKCLNSLKYS